LVSRELACRSWGVQTLPEDVLQHEYRVLHLCVGNGESAAGADHATVLTRRSLQTDFLRTYGMAPPAFVSLVALSGVEGVVLSASHSATLAPQLLEAGVPCVVGWETAGTSAAATLFCSEFYSSLNSDPSGNDFALAFRRAQRSLLSCHFVTIDPEDAAELARLRLEFGRRSLVAAGIPKLLTAKDMLQLQQEQMQRKLNQLQVQMHDAHEDLARGELGVPNLFLLLPKLRTRRGFPLRNTMVVVFLCPIDGQIARYGGKAGLKFHTPMGWVGALARFRQQHPLLVSLSVLGVSAALKLFSGLSIRDVVPASCIPSDTSLTAIDFLSGYVRDAGSADGTADAAALLSDTTEATVDGADVDAALKLAQLQAGSVGGSKAAVPQQEEQEQQVKGQQYRQFEQFLDSIGFDAAKLEMRKLVGPDNKARWVSTRHQSWP